MNEPSYSLGNFEELVLLAVFRLAENAYGASIRQAVAEATGRDTSVGAVYATLDRLERKGYVKSWLGEGTPERGGRPKRYFSVEGAGEEALRVTEGMRKKLTGWREGLKPA